MRNEILVEFKSKPLNKMEIEKVKYLSSESKLAVSNEFFFAPSLFSSLDPIESKLNDWESFLILRTSFPMMMKMIGYLYSFLIFFPLDHQLASIDSLWKKRKRKNIDGKRFRLIEIFIVHLSSLAFFFHQSKTILKGKNSDSSGFIHFISFRNNQTDSKSWRLLHKWTRVV